MRRVIFSLGAVLVFFIIAASTLELLTRFVADDGMQYDLEMWKYARDVKQIVSDPLLGHEHAPNRQARLMGVDFRTNSKGLRDREFSYDRTPGKRRILMLGDSLTAGWGVPLEDTFAKRLERLYTTIGIDTEVINTGVGNYNTIQEVQYFLTEGYKYKPDVVILNFFVNDAESLIPERFPSVVMRVCYACVFVIGRSDELGRRFFGKLNWSEYYLSLYDDGKSKGWLDAKKAIQTLVDYCKTNGVALLIASLPELHDVGNYHLQRITDLVHQAADQYDVPFVDILPYLKGHRSSALWITPSDPHPNGFADQLIARGLFDALQSHRMNVTSPPS
jgi:lysophospholipase L1-like esterase